MASNRHPGLLAPPVQKKAFRGKRSEFVLEFGRSLRTIQPIKLTTRLLQQRHANLIEQAADLHRRRIKIVYQK